MDLLKIGLVSTRLDPYALRDRAEWVLKPQLLAVPGVARITVFGGAVRQIQIQPQMDKLAAYGLTLTELADAGRAALALRGAGFLDLKAQRVLIESPTPSPDPAVVAEAVIAVRQGVPVRLRDVARVSEAPALQTGDALIQGQPGVLLSMSSQFGANTLTVTRAVEQALATLTPELKADGIQVYPALHRPANFIEGALHDISAVAAAGGRADTAGAVRVPAQLALGGHLLSRHPPVSGRRRRGAGTFRLHPQHHDPGRLRRGARRTGRRRHHRYREHAAPAAAERRQRGATAASGHHPRRDGRDPRPGAVRDAGGAGRVRAGTRNLGGSGPLRRPAGDRVHALGARLARRGPHRDPGALGTAAITARGTGRACAGSRRSSAGRRAAYTSPTGASCRWSPAS